MKPEIEEIRKRYNNFETRHQDIPALLSALEAAQEENKWLREALGSYAECSDGCTCGDGWGHETAVKALSRTEKEAHGKP